MDFELLCPCCNARLKIDPELKAVISHEAPKVPRTFQTVDDAIGALKTHDVEREKKFNASVEAEKSKKDVLNRKFDELFDRARKDDSRPIRDFDLD
ncbi:MAG: hypothetical protein LC796_08720 [Acidobacteria bacterium]|nr:hypothetical protein [Acidobacteriota bacterium]MCA1610489.1 hypothetical protein [Acidobacteriota bacterium]